MALTEDSVIWITKNRGISLESWAAEGKEPGYSIAPVQKAGDKLYYEWVRGKHYDKDAKKRVDDDKDRPLKVYLGTREEAIKALHSLLQGLGGDSQEPGPSIPDDSIPF
jgi:hypothetical protein